MDSNGAPNSKKLRSQRRKKNRLISSSSAKAEIEALKTMLKDCLATGHESHRENFKIIDDVAAEIGQKRLARAALGLHHFMEKNVGVDYLLKMSTQTHSHQVKKPHTHSQLRYLI